MSRAQDGVAPRAWLVMSAPDIAGALTLCAAGDGVPDDELLLVRITNGQEHVLAHPFAGEVRDKPPLSGDVRYQLRRGQVVLAERDLAPRTNSGGRKLLFLGGSEKRGVFEVVEQDGSSISIAAAVGQAIGDTRVNADGKVIDITSGVSVVKLALEAPWEESVLGQPVKDEKGTVIAGIDGKPMTINVPQRRRAKDARFVATVNVNGKEIILVEGESVPIE